MVNSLIEKLPLESKAFHAKWGGGEIWTQIKNFAKYEKENETCLPSIGEIMIMPQGNGTVAFDLWYDRGWAFGPTGFMNGAVIGKIVDGLDIFAKEAVKLSAEGAKNIKVELI